MYNYSWHLPRSLLTTEQKRHLPSASAETEPYTVAAVDLQHALREFMVELGHCSRWSQAHCSRQSGTVGLSVESPSPVQLFATPWTVAHQASLSNSQSLLKLMSIELVRPSNHLILCIYPSPPPLNLSQHQGVFT